MYFDNYHSMKCKELFKLIESEIPLGWQESYDNSGLQVGNPEDELRGILYSLDVTSDVIDKAIKEKCNVVISHHPLIFNGIKKIQPSDSIGKIIYKCINERISVYSAHTNFDKHPRGVNYALANAIGLKNQKILIPEANVLKKLVTYCPQAQAESVRNALFSAGAGQIGNYDSCSFNISGTGSFKAGENTTPFVGEKNKLHFEPEIRIETIFPSYKQNSVLSALFAHHPYEEVAYDIYTLDNKHSNLGLGIVGDLPKALPPSDFFTNVKSKLGIKSLRCNSNNINKIKRIAVCGGSGAAFLNKAIEENADVYITSDIKYHDFQAAVEKIILLDAGHFETEIFALNALKSLISKILPNFAPQINYPDSNWVNMV